MQENGQGHLEEMMRELDDYSSNKKKIQKDNILSNLKIFQRGKRKIIMGFENVEYPLPKKYVPNKYSFNESKKDASRDFAWRQG